MHTVSIDTVKRKSLEGSRFFFSPDTMRFFASRTAQQAYQTDAGAFFFVTSEQFDDHTPRLYTVRYMDNTGNIETVNLDGTCGSCPRQYDGFQGHDTNATATRAARAYATSNHIPTRQWHYTAEGQYTK